MNKRIGIDFGKTIANIYTVTDDEDQEYPNCFTILNHIVNRYSPANVYIISKARQENSKKIMSWLIDHDFFNRTNFLKKNIKFVEDCHEKRAWVDKLKINYFIDDNLKVVRAIYNAPSLDKIIWFQGKQELLKEIPKPYRKKIQISFNWNSIYKTFSKPGGVTLNLF